MARAGPAWLLLLLATWVLLLAWLSAAKVSSLIERISDPKDLKKLLRTRNNVLVLYSKSEAAAESHLKLLSTVAQAVKGQGTICWVDCGDAESRKLCKKMKVDLSLKDKTVELFHYQDGAFHMEYNRALTLKSIVAFLKDPKGPPLWEEDPGAKDVVHIDSEKDFRRLLKKEDKPLLMMFYAPWCGMCKRMMPHFQMAATQLRGHAVLAGMNVYPSEFENIKEEYGVRGYPTICYFEKGQFLFQYDNYGSTAEDIVEWLKKSPRRRSARASTGSSWHLLSWHLSRRGPQHHFQPLPGKASARDCALTGLSLPRVPFFFPLKIMIITMSSPAARHTSFCSRKRLHKQQSHLSAEHKNLPASLPCSNLFWFQNTLLSLWKDKARLKKKCSKLPAHPR